MTEQATEVHCKRCRRGGRPFRRLDAFDRVALADDPADAVCGYYVLETVYVMQCPACGHRQELVHARTPFATLREAQTEMDAHLLGKG